MRMMCATWRGHGSRRQRTRRSSQHLRTTPLKHGRGHTIIVGNDTNPLTAYIRERIRSDAIIVEGLHLPILGKNTFSIKVLGDVEARSVSECLKFCIIHVLYDHELFQALLIGAKIYLQRH